MLLATYYMLPAMNTRLFLLLSLIFSLLQGSLLPSVLAEGTLVLCYLLAREEKKAFLPVFAAGIIFDLVQSERLGLSSLIFVVFAVLLYGLQNTLPLRRPLYLAVFAALLNLARLRLVFDNFSLLSVIFGGILAFFLLSFFWRPEIQGRIKV